ncbi:MAG: universal stress protein [Thermomicrobiales bacterium]|jgi:nucleotide-binding universal stress UspA family protein|nr:universal stress protein [Thermomicrobiales bacterium]
METEIRRILLATDGSDDAEAATLAAADLAKRTGAALHIAQVWMPPLAVGAFPYPAFPLEAYIEQVKEQAGVVLQRAEAQVMAAGGTVAALHLRAGQPATELVALSEELAADLIITGSRGHGPVRRLVLGSVSSGLVHHATRPVLVIRGEPVAWPPAQIVSGDDGSVTAGVAAQLAAHLGACCDLPVTLVHAEPALAGQAPGDNKDRARALRQSVTMLERRARGLEPGPERRLRIKVVAGDPAEALLSTAAGRGPALIVVGSRGLGLVDRLRLGSVSNTLLHSASDPVLIVPPEWGRVRSRLTTLEPVSA